MNAAMLKRKDLTPASEILAEQIRTYLLLIIRPRMFDDDIENEDIWYTSPTFMMCFLPVSHTEANRLRWQTNCGRASLVIRAGELANPNRPNEYESCSVPAGAKGRSCLSATSTTTSSATRREP